MHVALHHATSHRLRDVLESSMRSLRPWVNRLLAACSAAFTLAGPVLGADDIEHVLERSQAQRLESTTPVPADDARAIVVRASFERLLAVADGAAGQAISLQVVRGPFVAETFHGSLIAANVDLADVPEGERLFVLAHELGHAVQGHWAAVGAVYRKHIPEEVMQSRTDAVAALLGREMSALAHEHELAADAYAMKTLLQLGFGLDVALATFARHGVQRDSATHPGTRKRVASLRLLAIPSGASKAGG